MNCSCVIVQFEGLAGNQLHLQADKHDGINQGRCINVGFEAFGLICLGRVYRSAGMTVHTEGCIYTG